MAGFQPRPHARPGTTNDEGTRVRVTALRTACVCRATVWPPLCVIGTSPRAFPVFGFVSLLPAK